MKLLKLISLISCVLLSNCNIRNPFIPIPTISSTSTYEIAPTHLPGISPEAAKYMNDAFDIIEENSIKRYQINWSELRTECTNSAKDAQIPKDTYLSIKCALFRLNDNHSILIPPGQSSVTGMATETYLPPPDAKMIQNRFGYIRVPGYSGSQQNLFGSDMQKQIRTIDSKHPCGWIVDLRGNGGGNMWPMLIGIGPILGEGIAGSFIAVNGNQEKWAYQDGKGLINGIAVAEVTGQPYSLTNPDSPVAVLFDSSTMSSGEAIAISFIGRPNTRSFGNNSKGLTTATKGYPLSDGAIILLADAFDADRNGKVYEHAIVPDVQVENDIPGVIPDEALQWLATQPECK